MIALSSREELRPPYRSRGGHWPPCNPCTRPCSAFTGDIQDVPWNMPLVMAKWRSPLIIEVMAFIIRKPKFRIKILELLRVIKNFIQISTIFLNFNKLVKSEQNSEYLRQYWQHKIVRPHFGIPGRTRMILLFLFQES